MLRDFSHGLENNIVLRAHQEAQWHNICLEVQDFIDRSRGISFCNSIYKEPIYKEPDCDSLFKNKRIKVCYIS